VLRDRFITSLVQNQWWLRLRVRFTRDPRKRALIRWLLEQPRDEARYVYPLTEHSVVLDLGGYQGTWSREMVRRYDPYIHIFEPVPAFAERLARQFATNAKVRVHAVALGAADGDLVLALSDDASSAYITAPQSVRGVCREVEAYLKEVGIDRVDLAKINIEGGEYPLLQRMIETGLITCWHDLQIQFHSFVPDAQQQYAALRAGLARTHKLTYDYPFLWENWRAVADS
jgi:FkbM family methyltransferase